MNLKANTIANYVSQIYVILSAIVVYPLYMKFMGPEAYGLVGFLATLQIWLQLLDAGMSPTFGRQVADHRGKTASSDELSALLRSLETVIFVGSIVVFVATWFSSHWLAEKWLQVKTLNLEDVMFCLKIMGLIIVSKWFSALYRSGVSGTEAQVWLSKVNVFINTLRTFGALALLKWFSISYTQFFEFQLFVSALEVLFYLFKFYGFLGGFRLNQSLFSVRSLKPFIPVAASMSFAVAAWILLSQLDRLLLSNILSLKEYGFFSVVAMVAGGILQISGPLSTALLPRMTYLWSANQRDGMLNIYEKSSQFLAILLLPAMAVCSIFGPDVLKLWVDSPELTEWAGPLMKWYIWSNGLSVLMSITFVVQFAHGNLKMHVWNTAILTAITVPCMVFCAYHYKAMGTALCWFSVNALMFLYWPYLVHRKFAPELKATWYKNMLMPFAFSFGPALLFKFFGFDIFKLSRIDGVLWLFVVSICTQILAVVTNKYCRATLSRWLHRPRQAAANLQ